METVSPCDQMDNIQAYKGLKKQQQQNVTYYDTTRHANFRGKPLFQATKQHFNNS